MEEHVCLCVCVIYLQCVCMDKKEKGFVMCECYVINNAGTDTMNHRVMAVGAVRR